MQSNKILGARKAKGWTQQELAERMGTSKQGVQRYEAGTRDLKASTAACEHAPHGVSCDPYSMPRCRWPEVWPGRREGAGLPSLAALTASDRRLTA